MSVLIRPAHPDDLDELILEARIDNHDVMLPQHVIIKDDTIAGYISIVPALHGWLHTRHINAFETFRTVFPTVDSIAKSQGHKHLWYFTGKQSFITPFATRIGYHHIGSTELFAKQL